METKKTAVKGAEIFARFHMRGYEMDDMAIALAMSANTSECRLVFFSFIYTYVVNVLSVKTRASIFIFGGVSNL